ncbi:MAG: EamA family transporter RarD [Alphaproteobacteria bacterium]
MSEAVARPEASSAERAGFIAAASAYGLWGVLPLYIKLIGFADAREVLAQRILWCAPAAFAAVFVMSGWRAGAAEIRAALKPRMLATLAASALFIFLNWSLYVWLVLHARVIEASLAYFLAPLVSVGIGVTFFHERIGGAKIAALVLAALGVVVQAWALGAPPWMALALCATWSMYALIRKRAVVPAATGLFIESLVLIPIAVALLWSVGVPLAFTQSPAHALMLALAGPITALPLMLFAFGARRVSFTSLGLLQYVAPSLQFLLGLAFGEPLTPLRAASFALIWAGLVLFSWDTLRRSKFA